MVCSHISHEDPLRATEAARPSLPAELEVSIPSGPGGPADAQSAYTILPEGKTYENKFAFGIYRGSEMVGCADLIRGYPGAATAYVGLLLVWEEHQGQGIGRLAFHLLEEFVRGWRTCDRIREAVAG